MATEPDFVSGFLSRNRVAFIHSRGQRKFFGRSADEGYPEVTVEDIEALASAGFDIVESNMSDGRPLCAALMAAPGGVLPFTATSSFSTSNHHEEAPRHGSA